MVDFGSEKLSEDSTHINNALNHKLRRYYKKEDLKRDIVTDVDARGKITSTNKHRIETRKKANNSDYWLENVNESVKIGKSVERFNREFIYNEELKREDERNAKLLQNLTEKYGMDEGTELYNKELEHQRKKMEKKKNKK